MEAVATALSLPIGLFMLAAVLGALSSQITSGSLPRNSIVGIRTRTTKASDAAWHAGHDAARPLVRASAWAAGASGALDVGVAFWAGPDSVRLVLVVGAVGYAVTVGLLLLAARRADRAGRMAEEEAG